MPKQGVPGAKARSIWATQAEAKDVRDYLEKRREFADKDSAEKKNKIMTTLLAMDDDRIDRIEQKLDRVEQKMDKILGYCEGED
jgi:RNA polymerase-binding transcription factor DksA